jgi:transglutaminase-like putative cysteine protease
MSLDRYFRISSYALVATSFLMLVATGSLDLLAPALYGGVLVAGWLIDSGRWRWRVPKKLANWLVVAYVPLALGDWLALGSAPVVVVIHFILFASSLKLLHPKENRDWLWLYVVAFFEMLLAAGMTIDTTFFALMLVFLFAALSTLTSFEIRRAQQEAIASTAEIEIRREAQAERRTIGQLRWRPLSYFSLLALVVILLLAAPLFLAMPRLSSGLFGGGLMSGATLSGFSDKVRLGDVAQVKLNSQVVMHVRVQQQPEQYRMPLRWRGVTLDRYENGGWSDSTRQRKFPLPQKSEGFEVEPVTDRRFITRQEFYLTPLDTGVLFAAPKPLLVSTRSLARLYQDSSDGLWAGGSRSGYLIYTVQSDTRVYREAELRADNQRDYPIEIRQRYLQLPAGLDARIGELAAQITHGTHTQHDAARRIEEYLRTSLSYTLDLKRTTSGDPLPDFLFNVKAGHCEYFATAMAIMLRTQGIPARLVNGFQTGEYSEIADWFTVRQSDAHSWVEVYYPQHGWVAFDPTPAAGLNKYEGGYLAVLRHYGEALELFWMEKVIGFDAQDQLSIALRMQRLLSSWQGDAASKWSDWREGFAEWLRSRREGRNGAAPDLSVPDLIRNLLLHPVALALYCLIGLAGAGWYWRQRQQSWRHHATRDAAGSAVAFYQEMLDALARAGHTRRPDQTPLEFAGALSIPAVTEMTRIYQQVRFGGGKLTSAEIELISHLLKDLKKQKASELN